METTTQPILCCLGESVAGNPTQFMMERAIASLGLDWRVMTVEVAAADFRDAMAGIKAMKLQAVRFLGAFEQASIQLLAGDEASEFVGGITSAVLTDQGLVGWHNRGYGIRAELSRGEKWGDTICWLHGDSVATRSFLVAAVHGDAPKRIFWSAPPQTIPNSLLATRSEGVAVELLSDGADVLQLLTASDLLDPAESTWVHNGQMALIGDVPEPGRLGESEWFRSLGEIRLVALSPDGQAAMKELDVPVKFVTEIDQVISSEAYDFLRWTGHNADAGQLRDAYEEYCDF